MEEESDLSSDGDGAEIEGDGAVSRLMEEHGIDEEIAERAHELIDEGLDKDGAVELAEDNL